MTQRAKLYPCSDVTPEPDWFAVQTRSRHEKRVTRYLTEKGVQAYLPLVPTLHRWSDRRKIVHLPLFSGYVFINAIWDAAAQISVLRTSGVVGVVGVGGVASPIPKKEIEDIYTLLSQHVEFDPHPFITSGQRVRIRGGALHGIEGIVVEKNSDCSLILSVEMIQRSVAVRISGYDLDRI